MGEELHGMQAEESSGRGSAKLPTVQTFPMRLPGGEFEATAHCSIRSDSGAAQVRIMRCVGQQLRRLPAAATSGPGSSDVLSSMHSDTVL